MFKVFLISLILYIIFDLLWFTISLPIIYLPKFTEIQGQKPIFFNKIHGGFFAWFLLALGLSIFVTPKANSTMTAAIYGFLYGLVVYGVYNGTNYVTLNKYDYGIAIPDLLWGSLASMAISVIVYKSQNIMK